MMNERTAMPEREAKDRETACNLVQTLARAVELALFAHDFDPRELKIEYTTEYTETNYFPKLRISVDGVSVEFDPERERLCPVYGDVRVVKKTGMEVRR